MSNYSRNVFFNALVLSFAVALSAHAQSPIQVPRIGCGGDLIAPDIGTSLQSAQNRLPRTSSSEPIEVLFAYTPKVLTQFGSLVNLQDEAARIIAYANNAHINSSSSVTFVLVGMYQLTSEATDDFSNDLDAVTFSDGVWDDVLIKREEVGADVVSVLVAGTEGGKLCGLAWTNGVRNTFERSSSFMFSIVSLSSKCTRETFAHEVGHNLGSTHARTDVTSGGSQIYSYGYRFTGESGQAWHTIMASPGSDLLVPYFSTPLLSHDGVPLGVAESEDNVRAMAISYPIVASLLPSKGLVDLSQPERGEIDSVKVSYTRSSDGSRIKIVVTPTSRKKKLSQQPVQIFFSKGKKGILKLRAFGRTNSAGTFSFNEKGNVAPGFYYKACAPSYLVNSRCTSQKEISRVR